MKNKLQKHKKINIHKNTYSTFLSDKILIIFVLLFLASSLVYFTNDTNTKGIFTRNDILPPSKLKVKLLFAGDIFLDRGIDSKSQKSDLKYSHPFSGLDTLNRSTYDAWIGNLECPVTEEQSSMFEKEEYLKFSCKKEYLPELKKYFNIVSLANNHTDNMGGKKSILETREHLKNAGINFFGDYDNSVKEEVCKIIFIKLSDPNIQFPFAFCGFHGVYKLPTDDEIKVISEYSKFFITFVMPHQGEEYQSQSNTYQKRIYHKFIDQGADMVVGSHPHVIQETEEYNGKKIFYSLGNFIFDQYWLKTRQHLVLDTEVKIDTYLKNYQNLYCENLSSLECLQKAKNLSIKKPEFDLVVNPIFTEAGNDYITRKRTLTDKEYQQELTKINFYR